MLFAVSYDIPSNRRRRRLASALQKIAFRVQKSVFECYLEPGAHRQLIALVKKIVRPDEDSVRIYPLPAGLHDQIVTVGRPPLTADDAFWHARFSPSARRGKQ